MYFLGNAKSCELLSRSLENGKLNHAYIFSGPEHVGKFTLAKMFATSAISEKKMSLDTKNEDKDAMLDLIVLEPEIVQKRGILKKRDIQIESIREAKSSLSLFPYHGKYKVLIIDEAHRMSLSSQNALLKILEEPNKTTIIILITNELEKILSTIRSRAQVVNFLLVDDSEMNKSFSEELVSLSIGRPGLANLLNHDENEKLFRIETRNQLRSLAQKTLNEKLGLAEELSKNVVKTLEKLDIWIWEMRKEMILVGSDVKNRKRTFKKIEEIQKSIEKLKSTNANPRLVLEVLLVNL